MVDGLLLLRVGSSGGKGAMISPPGVEGSSSELGLSFRVSVGEREGSTSTDRGSAVVGLLGVRGSKGMVGVEGESRRDSGGGLSSGFVVDTEGETDGPGTGGEGGRTVVRGGPRSTKT